MILTLPPPCFADEKTKAHKGYEMPEDSSSWCCGDFLVSRQYCLMTKRRPEGNIFYMLKCL